MTGVAAVQARISEIETSIRSFAQASRVTASVGSTAASSVAVPATSGTDFAAALAALQNIDGSAGTTGAPSLVDQVKALTGAAPAAPASARPAVSGDALVAEARKFLGVPYAWGGESMSGIDCSGLVQRALGALGVDMPRVARDQAKEGTAVASMADARVGDLLVFDGGSHIAIYLGAGRMIDAPKPGDTVRERDVYETPTAIRRVLPDATGDLLASSAAQRSSLSLLLGAAA